MNMIQLGPEARFSAPMSWDEVDQKIGMLALPTEETMRDIIENPEQMPSVAEGLLDDRTALAHVNQAAFYLAESQQTHTLTGEKIVPIQKKLNRTKAALHLVSLSVVGREAATA